MEKFASLAVFLRLWKWQIWHSPLSWNASPRFFLQNRTPACQAIKATIGFCVYMEMSDLFTVFHNIMWNTSRKNALFWQKMPDDGKNDDRFYPTNEMKKQVSLSLTDRDGRWKLLPDKTRWFFTGLVFSDKSLQNGDRYKSFITIIALHLFFLNLRSFHFKTLYTNSCIHLTSTGTYNHLPLRLVNDQAEVSGNSRFPGFPGI